MAAWCLNQGPINMFIINYTLVQVQQESSFITDSTTVHYVFHSIKYVSLYTFNICVAYSILVTMFHTARSVQVIGGIPHEHHHLIMQVLVFIFAVILLVGSFCRPLWETTSIIY